MSGYEFFHLSMKCIGVGFFVAMAILVVLMAISSGDDGESR